MTKQIMALVLFLISAAGVTAAPNLSNARPDSISGLDQKTYAVKDTQFVLATVPDPFLSEKLMYKGRLDSIKRSVPMDYNEHVQKYIDIYVGKRKDHISKMLGLSKYYFPIFEKSLKEMGVPDEIKFIAIIESALNPNAVSKSGAVGPWQFMYTTARGYGLVIDNYVDQRKDPVQATYAAAHYIKDAYNVLGDWLLAIAAYNCGTGAVTRAIARSGGEANFWKVRPYLPLETQNYIPAFIATAYAMNYYKKHDINPTAADVNILTDAIDVTRSISLSSIARAVEVDARELVLLNPAYKKQVINGSPQSPKKLIIPAINKQFYSSLYDLLNGREDEQQVIAASTHVISNPLAKGITSIKVQEGQTLAMIANQYGVEVQDLKVWNDLKVLQVVPGQEIRVTSGKAIDSGQKSSSAYRIYIVKVGDTLSGIADRFSTITVSKLKALNNLESSVVQPGMHLKINKSL